MDKLLRKTILEGKVGVTILDGNLNVGNGEPIDRRQVYRVLRQKSSSDITQALESVINMVVDGDQAKFVTTPCIIKEGEEIKLVELTKRELKGKKVVDPSNAARERRAFVTGGVTTIKLNESITAPGNFLNKAQSELKINSKEYCRCVLVDVGARDDIYYGSEASKSAFGVPTKKGYDILQKLGLDCAASSVEDDTISIPAMPLRRVSNF